MNEIRGGGGGSSRPGERGGGVIVGPVSNKVFRPFGPHFGLKIKGEGEGLPWIRHCLLPKGEKRVFISPFPPR